MQSAVDFRDLFRTLAGVADEVDDDADPITFAIQTCLVLAGVRRAARFEHAVSDALAVAVQTAAARVGKTVLLVSAWGRGQPMLVDATHAPPDVQKDIGTLQEVAANSEAAREDNDDAGIVAATQHLLGYPCPLDRHTPNSGREDVFVALFASVENVDEPEQEPGRISPAGFFCSKSAVLAAGGVNKLRAALLTRWVGPACRVLAGAECTVHGVPHMITGFALEVRLDERPVQRWAQRRRP